jgi:multiple sugar transport system permease protein
MATTDTVSRTESFPEESAPSSGLTDRRERRKHTRRRLLTVLGFMSPWIVGFGLFFVYPLIATVYYSFTRYDLINNPVLVGLRNYDYLLHNDPLLWQSVRNTVWLVIAITIGRVGYGLVCALVLARIRRGSGLYRTLFYLPALAPPVAAALAFVFLFNPGTGPVNQLLAHLGIAGPLWFNDPGLAKPALTVLALWASGEVMVILLAAVLDVSAELYEAAGLDGAGAWSQFRYVTLPSIAPILLFAVINSMIVGLQYFTEAVVAGAVASGSADAVGSGNLIGYPDNSTLTYPMWLYQQGFHNYNMGYASAMATVLFGVSAVITVVLVRRMRAAGITEETP